MKTHYITYEDYDYEGYEIFELINGTGQISLRGDSFETALLFEGKPVAFNWSDCHGSVGQFLARGTHHDEYKSSLDLIRKTVRGKTINMPLSSALEGLLSLFESGQYLLKEHTIEEYEYLDPDEKTDSFYPYEWMLIGTQPEKYLNEETIQKHIERIKSGLKPKLIVASVMLGWTHYIIDGHHKLAAYKRLNMQPMVIEIISVTAQPINVNEGTSYIISSLSKNQYLEVKNKNHRCVNPNKFRFIIDDSKKFFDAIFYEDKALIKALLEDDITLIKGITHMAYMHST